MPRIQKGSAEAKAWGQKMKALRSGRRGKAPAVASGDSIEEMPASITKKKRAGRLAKGSDAAKDFMAKLRSMKRGGKK
jgi:hypothetical protein